MNLLWIVALIQTIFFIVHNEHFYVLLFIGVSLCINAFSKNELCYLGFPILIVFMIYFLGKHNNIEGFKFKIKKPSIKKPSPPKVSVPKVKPPKKPSPPKVSVPKVSVPKVSVPKVSVPKVSSVTSSVSKSKSKSNPFASMKKSLNKAVDKIKEKSEQAYNDTSDIATNSFLDAYNDNVNMMKQQQETLDQTLEINLFLAEQLAG
jgi:hypothetical protein